MSTTEQSVDNQQDQIEQAFPGTKVHWFIEHGVSGKTPNAERPEFLKATKIPQRNLVFQSLQ